jgi:tetratricopeptide (TPR) repeat protein
MADTQAARYADRLTDENKLLLRAYAAFRRGDAEAAEQIYHGLVANNSGNGEAWQQLGETYFHYNPLRGRPIAEARVPFQKALDLRPDSWDALWHLAQLALSDGDHDAARGYFDALLALHPGTSQSLELRVLRALASKDRAAESALAPELARADELQLFQIIWRSSMYAGDLEAAERIARVMIAPGRPRNARYLGHRSLASIHYARGRWRAAEAELKAWRVALPDHPDNPFLYRAFFIPFVLPARPVAELTALRDSVLLVGNGKRDALHLMLAGVIEAAISDTSAGLASTRAATLEEMGDASAAATVRASVALHRGDMPAALRNIEHAFDFSWFGFTVTSPNLSRMLERFLYAEALVAAGRYREAIGWYASFGELAVHELPLLGASLIRRGELYEKLGDRKRAADHYARLVELWRDCDPEFLPVRDTARARVAVLTR